MKSWQFCKRMANKAEIVLAQHANQCQNIVHLAHFCTSTIFFIHRNIVACRYCNSSGLAFFAGWQMHHILIFHTQLVLYNWFIAPPDNPRFCKTSFSWGYAHDSNQGWRSFILMLSENTCWWRKQGIDQQIFDRKLISWKITYPWSLLK